MKETHRILTELEITGDLKKLVMVGFCNPSVFRNLEIYRYVDSRMKTGLNKEGAVLAAEVQFKLCRKTVYNVLRFFK